jgi:quinol monooxygenase YgiN
MLIVAGTFEVDPAEREAFLKGREEAMRTSRAEPGCLDYVFSADPLEPGRVILFERWESKEALAAHLEGMRANRGSGPGGGGGGRPGGAVNVVQYEVTGSGPVGS